MKRILLIVTIIASVVPTLWAQKGLNINSLFDGRYRKQQNVVETIISGNQVYQSYAIDLYHGLTITGKPDEAKAIEQRVAKDGEKALSRDVYYQRGQLMYGFYVMPPRDGKNRYIIYMNRGSGRLNKLTLIYIEGKATPGMIKSLIN